MKREDIIVIGKIIKPDGVKGFIRPEVDITFEKSLEKSPFIFIFIDGLPIPFKIENCKPDRDYSLKLEWVDTPEQASRFNNLPIGLHEKHVLTPKKYAKTTSESWTGYVLMVHDQEAGTVLEVAKFPGQLMLVLEKKDGETFHVPLVEDWVDNIDHDGKVIRMNLPDGLLDV